MRITLLSSLILLLTTQGASAQTLYFRAPLLGASSTNSIGQPDIGEEESESEENQTCYDIEQDGSPMLPFFGDSETSGAPSITLERFSFKDSLDNEEKAVAFQEEFAGLVDVDYSQYTYEDFPLHFVFIRDENNPVATLSTESELSSYGITNVSNFTMYEESDDSGSFFVEYPQNIRYCETNNGGVDGSDGPPTEGEGEVATIESFNTTPISFIQEGNCHYDIEVNTSGDASKLEVVFQSNNNSTEQFYSIDLPSQSGGVFSVLTGNIYNANVNSLVQPDGIVDFGGDYNIVLNLYNSSNSIMDTKTIENFEAPHYLGESELFYDEDDDYYLEISYDEGRKWPSTGRGFHPSSSAFRFSENPNVQTKNLMDEYSFNYDGSQTIISELFPYIPTDQNYPMTVEKYEYTVAKICYIFS